MSKRRQRSTAIRKRIEKRAREESKAKRKAERAGGGKEGGTLVVTTLERAKTDACCVALEDLTARLQRESIRGWSKADVEGDQNLGWLGALLREALDADPEADPVSIEFFDENKAKLLDRLGALELAASGLRVAWDEAGFNDLVRALHSAEEAPEEEPEPSASADEGDETSGDETGDEAPADDAQQ